jgi:hypothetical protein
MLAILLSLLGPFVVGTLLAWRAWPGIGPIWWRGTFAAALGLGLALGLGSGTFFVWAACPGHDRIGFLVAEILFFVVVCALILFVWRRQSSADLLPPAMRSRWAWAIYAAFVLVLIFALTALELDLSRVHHGEIDAWQIWNLHARLLERDTARWPEILARLEQWSHPDYPLLLSATIARSWHVTGEETTLAPRVIAFLFWAATVGLLLAGVALLRTPSQGCLAALVLMATPSFLHFTGAQYADVPLAFYFLATNTLLESHARLRPSGLRLPLLAGLTAGMAAWTKNEGVLFLIVSLLVQFVLAAYSLWVTREGSRTFLAFALGLLPFSLILAYFKVRLAAPSDLFLEQNAGSFFSRLFDLKRTEMIFGEMTAALARIGRGAIFLLGLYGFLVGGARGGAGMGQYTMIVVVLMLCGYALVYQMSPHNLELHIYFSVDRLYVQLWPSAVMAFFLRVAAPEEKLGRVATQA